MGYDVFFKDFHETGIYKCNVPCANPIFTVGNKSPYYNAAAFTKIQTQDELDKEIAEWLKTMQFVDEAISYDPKIDIPVAAPHKCHCSREQVLYKGCKCGGI
jgi:hypothetical protein